MTRPWDRWDRSSVPSGRSIVRCVDRARPARLGRVAASGGSSMPQACGLRRGGSAWPGSRSPSLSLRGAGATSGAGDGVMMARAMVRRLCALAVLTVLVAAPPPLLAATCNVPRQVAAILGSITGSGTEGLCGTTSPVGSLIGFVVLSVWVYLVLVAALRAAALLGTRARIAGSARLLVLTNRFLGGGRVRHQIDVTIGIGMVAASGSGHLTPQSGTGPPAPMPAAAPAHQASLTEQVAELLGLDGSAGLLPTTDDDEERLYVV